MGQITETRKRLLARSGRQMVLTARDGSNPVTLRAYAPPPQSSQLADGMPKAPFIAQTLADELSAANVTPKAQWHLTDGPKTYSLTDATPVYDGATICGWTLIAAGGD
ncbi:MULTISPECIES: hypothetical protein [Acetobacter]|nr:MULTISPECIES: hypothetical protein [Acetobacter]AXC25911.1 hypothetical protein DS739_03335 [Acetobacter sp. JWB]AXC27602.1 hypothetical protein DS739_13195 [Acetobacter sp. JWB]KAA8426535.1 hypothetical protein FKW54_06820 [Acetobacter pomorum]KAA8436008.1 hypothetical protein FKW50_05680 [Acetobacter pomorum]KAA8454070.1 hypothetical protein FKW52_01950 [Acetobacter pomorum]